MNELGLTLDIDWAPDIAIDTVARRLVSEEVRATWFVTHKSAAVERLREFPALFELGIHPNFLPGSSHGSSTTEVLDHCAQLVPDAVSMRSHAVFQHGRLYNEILERTGVRIDSTTFLPEMEHVRVLDQPTTAGDLRRIPFVWADDYELAKPDPMWNVNRFDERPGLHILMFHPIHVYMNTPSFEHYERVKRSDAFRRNTSASGLAKLRHDGNGIATVFDDLLSRLSQKGGGLCIRDLL